MNCLRKHFTETVQRLGRDTQAAVVDATNPLALAVRQSLRQCIKSGGSTAQNADLFAFQDVQCLTDDMFKVALARQRAIREALGPARVKINAERVETTGATRKLAYCLADNVR